MAVVGDKQKKNFIEILVLSGLNDRISVKNERKGEGQTVYFNL